jgi:DNA-binding XRE family transcriptional regulator
MDILAVQQRFIDAGYQFVEHIFNDDRGVGNCSIQFTKDECPHYFTKHPLGDFGWGRFPRMDAWRNAAEWLDEQESVSDFHVKVGAAIAALRKARNMTMAEVAAATGVAESTYCEIENGTTNARIDSLSKIARGLGVQLAFQLVPKKPVNP